MYGGQWTDQKLKWTPFQSLRCHSMQSGTTKEHKHTHELRRAQNHSAWSRETGQKSRIDKRSTGRRSEKGRTEKEEEVTDQAAEVTEAESSAPAASGPRESPIGPDPNPKRGSIMK